MQSLRLALLCALLRGLRVRIWMRAKTSAIMSYHLEHHPTLQSSVKGWCKGVRLSRSVAFCHYYCPCKCSRSLPLCSFNHPPLPTSNDTAHHHPYISCRYPFHILGYNRVERASWIGQSSEKGQWSRRKLWNQWEETLVREGSCAAEMEARHRSCLRHHARHRSSSSVHVFSSAWQLPSHTSLLLICQDDLS